MKLVKQKSVGKPTEQRHDYIMQNQMFTLLTFILSSMWMVVLHYLWWGRSQIFIFCNLCYKVIIGQTIVTSRPVILYNFFTPWIFKTLTSYSVEKSSYYTKLKNLCSLYGRWFMTDTVQGYFRRILQLSSGHECPGICECPKSAQNNHAR